MKSFLRAAAASGLAAATVVSGLAFGPAAANAHPGAATEIRPLVLQSNGKYWAVGNQNNASGAAVTSYDTRDEAAAHARHYEVSLGAPAPLRLVGTNQCLSDQGGYVLKLATCSGSTGQSYRLVGGKLQRDNGQRIEVFSGRNALRLAATGSPVEFRLGSELTTEATLPLIKGTTSDWIYLQPSSGDFQGNGWLTVPEGMQIVDHLLVRHATGGEWLPWKEPEPRYTLSDGGRTLRAWWLPSGEGDNIHWGPGLFGIAVKVAVDKDYVDEVAPFHMQVERREYNKFVNYDMTADVSVSALSASVASVSVEEGTAVLAGRALPNAWIEVDGKTQDRVQADDEGRWTYTLTGLPFGRTQHTMLQFDGADLAGETSVEVDLAVSPLTVEASFEDTIDAPAALSGTAHPGASIDVTNGSGTVVGRTMANAAGDWSVPVPAPDAPGAYRLSVEQKVGGRPAGTQEATIEYGDTVAISIPEDGYDVEPGKALTMIGTGEKHADGEPAAKVKVFEKGKAQDILGTADVSKLGNWQLRTPVLEDREYTLVVQQTGRGGNVTTAEVVVNEGESAVPAPTAEVAFDADVSKKATVKGTGVDGATITVKDSEGKTLGSTKVRDGAWAVEIDPLGAGVHTVTVEQSGIEGTQTVTTEIDYGAAVAITDPAAGTVSPGTVHVSGTGADGAAVRVEAGGETATTTVVDGTWSTDIEIPAGKDAVEITVTQQSKGRLTTTAAVSVTPDGSQQLQPVVITEPASGIYSNDGKALEVKGTATPYATVTVTSQWSTLKTVTADRDGNWSFWRGFGPNVTYELKATQTTVSGQTSESTVFTLAPEGGDANAPVVITEPADGHYASGGATLVKGTAAANATVEVRADWGVLKTVKADAMGNWSFWRGFGPSVTYHLVAKQTKVDGSTSESAVFTLSPEGGDSTAPVTITGPADGHYLSGAATQVTGTAGADATVEIRDQWKVLTTVKADAAGHWSFWRHFGPTVTYQLVAKQTKTDGTTSESTVFTLAPQASQTSPVVITGPTDGYDPSGAATLMTGTASPGATVEVRSQWGVLKTVTADADGHWSFWRGYGPDVTYQVVAEQTRTDGSTSESAVFTLAPRSAAVS